MLKKNPSNRIHFLWLLLWLLLIAVPVLSTTTSPSSLLSIEEPNKEILRLQNQLVLLLSSESESDEEEESSREIIESKLELAVQQEVKRLRKVFRETPRPSDRDDDPKQPPTLLPQGKEEQLLEFGTSLWYLIEIPQWWITAQVVKDLGDNNRLLIHQTASGNEFEAIRGQQVRTVLPADEIVWQSQYLRDLGELARIHNNPEERASYYRQAIEMDPTNPHPLDNLALYYMDIGEYDKGEELLRQSIEIQPYWYHSYYNLGILIRDHPSNHNFATSPQATQKEALRLFQIAFQLNPLFLDSLLNVAETYLKMSEQQQQPQIECYYWRLLRILNRNPSPDDNNERNFGNWNPTWEDYITQRIQQCMEKALLLVQGSNDAMKREEL